MLKTGLEFAPGTTEDCKQLVAKLFDPGTLLASYRAKRIDLKTGDLVLVGSSYDPTLKVIKRLDYVEIIKRGIEKRTERPGKMPALFEVLEHQTAHKIVKLPFEHDAFWLVVARGDQELPILCAVFVTQYEVATESAEVVTS
jgi:hypothetical protein